MTITSIINNRTLSIQDTATDNVAVDIGTGGGLVTIFVSADQFAREIKALRIPGLTVTYEKPIVEPEHETDAVYRVLYGLAKRHAIAWAAHDGTWDIIDGQGDAAKGATSIIGALDSHGWDTSETTFTRLIPENESDV